MKSIRLICLFACLLLCLNTIAQEQFTRDINKSFPSYKCKNVSIENMYGNVRIIPSIRDSVSFYITISLEHLEAQKASQLLNELQVEFSNSNNTIAATTKILDDFNTTFSFSINYTVYVPENINLIVENRFGDIRAEGNLKNNADFSIHYGNMFINNLLATNEAKNNYLKLNYSTAEIKNISNSKILTNYSKLKIYEANNLIVSSKCSKIELENSESYVSNSLRDNLLINKCKSLSIKKAEFSLIDVENGISYTDVNLISGTLIIKKIEAFEKIKLESEDSVIELEIADSINYALKADFRETEHLLPENLNYYYNVKDKDTNAVLIEAVRGDKSADIHSFIDIRAKRGNIKL